MTATIATTSAVRARRQSLYRKLAALIAVALAVTAFSVSHTKQADALTLQRRWYGTDVQLNRSETNHLMFASGSAAIASAFIPDPTVSKAVAASLGLYTGYANWVYNRGGCVKFRVTVTHQVLVAHYFKGCK